METWQGKVQHGVGKGSPSVILAKESPTCVGKGKSKCNLGKGPGEHDMADGSTRRLARWMKSRGLEGSERREAEVGG